jgi:hypothetical protein
VLAILLEIHTFAATTFWRMERAGFDADAPDAYPLGATGLIASPAMLSIMARIDTRSIADKLLVPAVRQASPPRAVRRGVAGGYTALLGRFTSPPPTTKEDDQANPRYVSQQSSLLPHLQDPLTVLS